MRIRTLKPEWVDDENLVELSDAGRVLSAALNLFADDEGRFVVKPHIPHQVWPGAPAKFEKALSELLGWYCVEYLHGKKRIVQVCNFKKHQRISKPSPSKLPPPPADVALLSDDGNFQPIPEGSATPTGKVSEASANATGKVAVGTGNREQGSGREQGTGMQGGDADASPTVPDPTQEIFDLWASSFDKGANTQLTSKRKSKIRQRLKRWKPEQLKTAIQNYAHDPWRHEDPVRHELATLLRDDEHVETGLAKRKGSSGRGGAPPAAVSDWSGVETCDVDSLFEASA